MRFIYKFVTSVCMIAIPILAVGQIGIGTQAPDPSAIMDVTSQKQGFLTPRMTTAQREAIEDPANGLLVFDTDLNSFEYYTTSSTSWGRMSSTKRDNYVLVKSQADFPNPVGNLITLDENTFYEINGTIALTSSIDLNGAYISGLDASEDVLSFPGGTIFKGSGGSIRYVTLTGAKAFEIEGPGIATNSSLLVQNTTISGMTNSVGTISNLGIFFGNVIQFINNTSGLTYSNIGNLLLNNQAWFGNNSGTYEKLEDNFGLVEKVSGFSTVNGSAVGFDVSANPAVPNGVLLSTVFSGSGSYVNKYTSGSYIGFNFTNDWTINCPGIPAEDDGTATGNLYYTNSSVVTLSNNNAIKLPVSTTSIRNFRTSSTTSNRLVYEGTKGRSLNIYGTISFTSIAGMRVTFSIYKNGNLVPGTEVIYDITTTNAREGLAIVGTVMVDPSDYVEIYVERNTSSGSNQFLVTSYNLLVN
ncbi:MAG TPA: hypothetical protein ENH91_04685 [Leeuwenhoekiella sp.]|nr:hypothetical protein [Leeuwenhoekiella sp.]